LSAEEQHQQQVVDELKNKLKSRKASYQKNPCKMHQISNWMVVNLFQDLEYEILQSGLQNHNHNNHNNNNKFDIQLNDLNNGNMYKYRFDSLWLAKEWYEKFKSASTYHERHKLDNLIKFD
jgi:hypothetical protein